MSKTGPNTGWTASSRKITREKIKMAGRRSEDVGWGSRSIFSRAKGLDAKVGIGLGSDKEKVEKSVAEVERLNIARMSVYTDPTLLAEDLHAGIIDAAVRGDLGSNPSMQALRERFVVPKVLRAALMEPLGGGMFVLAPVGIDEGWTVEEKVRLAELCADLVKRLGGVPKIAFLSGGRNSDLGRMAQVDRTINDAEAAAEIFRNKGGDARHAEILIEDAVKDCNIIIAPDGISGNLIFRTLHFLGEGKAMGAPVLNIDKIYIDTSRAKASYSDAIALASVLAASQTL